MSDNCEKESIAVLRRDHHNVALGEIGCRASFLPARPELREWPCPPLATLHKQFLYSALSLGIRNGSVVHSANVFRISSSHLHRVCTQFPIRQDTHARQNEELAALHTESGVGSGSLPTRVLRENCKVVSYLTCPEIKSWGRSLLPVTAAKRKSPQVTIVSAQELCCTMSILSIACPEAKG